MFSSPTPAPGTRTVAGSALKSVGLIDRDAKMRDVDDKQGGRKGSSRIRSHRPRPIDALKDRGPTSSSAKHLLANRISASHATSSDPLSIRGAAVRPSGRGRRNAVSGATNVVVTSRSQPKPLHAWSEFVNKRWNKELRLLDLSSIKDDELVKKNNLAVPGSGGTAREMAVIFKLASKLDGQVMSLDLSNNNLTGQHLSQLGHYLPDLANLSLHGNNLKTQGDLDILAGKKTGKLVNLQELILTGNGVRDFEYQNGRGDSFRSRVTTLFPSLHMLDREPVVQIAFDSPSHASTSSDVPAPTATTFPFDMSGSLISGVSPEMISSFLVRFFSLFDNQRGGLIDVYDPYATFSYSVNTHIPERARIQGYQNKLPNQYKLKWNPWLNVDESGSRNLSRLATNLDKQIQRLHIGGQSIVNVVSKLPQLRHDIGGPQENFCVDSFTIELGQQMGLMARVHGQFTELPAEGLRSFDRTFILAPAPEGSRAKLAGWNVVIISDQWTIRAYSSPDAWKPGPMTVQAPPRNLQQQRQDSMQATPTPASVAQPPQLQLPPGMSLPPAEQNALLPIPEPQRSMVVQVIGRTGLNVKYSVDCLTENGWDLEKAVANFIAVRETLPREAFI